MRKIKETENEKYLFKNYTYELGKDSAVIIEYCELEKGIIIKDRLNNERILIYAEQFEEIYKQGVELGFFKKENE